MFVCVHTGGYIEYALPSVQWNVIKEFTFYRMGIHYH
jgi:hypothetical protein